MATQLASQLSSLRTPQTDLLISRKRKVSILFPAEKAKTISREQFYEIGARGFAELVEMNAKFREFEETLFDPRSKSSQRAHHSQEDNKIMDGIIEKFLMMVSPYINLGAAKQALEWLLQRFMVHEMNINAFVFCILPYHAQASFIRILSTINLKREEKAWDWLLLYQKNGHPVPAKTIAVHWATNSWFRNTMATSFKKYKKILSEGEMEIYSKFYSDVVIRGIIQCDKVSEKHVGSVFQTLGKFLQEEFTPNTDRGLSQILALSEKATLVETLFHKVIDHVSKLVMKESSPMEKLTVVLLFLCKQQQLETLSDTSVENFKENDSFLTGLSSLASHTSVVAFVSPFVKQWTGKALSKEPEEMNKILDFLITTPFVPAEANIILGSFGEVLLDTQEDLQTLCQNDNLGQLLLDLHMSHPGCLPDQILALAKSTDTDMLDSSEEPMEVDETEGEKLGKGPQRFQDLMDRAASLDLQKVLHDGYQDEYPCDMTEARDILWESSQARDQRFIKESHYEEISTAVIKDNLDSPSSRVQFLSMMWTVCSKDAEKDQHLRRWSMRMAHHMLKTIYKNTESMEWASDDKFLASLLVPLCRGDRDIRRRCFSTFTMLQEHCQLKGFKVLLEGILSLEQEILNDISYLPASISKLMANKKKWGFAIKELLALLETDTPLRLQSSILYCLSEVQTKTILPKLVPLAMKIIESIDTTKELEESSSLCLYYILMRLSSSTPAAFKDAAVKDLLMKCLCMDSPSIVLHGDTFSPRDFVTKSSFLEELSSSTKVNFTEILGALIPHMTVPTVHSKRRLWKQLKKVPVDAECLLEVLSGLKLLESSGNSVKETRRKSLKITTNEEEENRKKEKWLQVEVIADLAEGLHELRDPQLLVTPLFDHLMALQKFEASFTDVLQQKLHDAVYHLIHTCVSTLPVEDIVDSVKVNVGGLVHTIRLSHNPSCKRKALMILTLLAQYFPEEVLPSILPIFTFMGGSLSRRDDSHSVEILHEAIHSIVPVLLQSKTTEKEPLLPKVSQVLRAFVDARHDIPEHRKFPLFTALGGLLVQHQQLWILMPLVVDSLSGNCNANQMGKEGRSLDCINFVLQVYSQFNVCSQLQSLLEVVHFVCSLPQSYNEYTKVKPSVRDERLLVIPMEDRTPKQLRSLKYNTAGVVFQLISSAKFNHELSKVLEDPEEQSGAIDNLKSIIAKVIEYLQVIQDKIDKCEDQTPESFWCRLQKRFLDILRVCTGMLPPPLLLQVVRDFLGHQQPELRLCSLKMLVSKLQSPTPYFSSEDMEENEDLVTALITTGLDESVGSEMRQWSLLCVQSLIKMLPTAIPKKTMKTIVKRATENLLAGDLEEILQGQMLLTGCEALCSVKAAAINHLQPLLEYCFTVLKKAIDQYSSEQQALVVVCLKSLLNILSSLAEFLSSKIPHIILLLSHLALKMQGHTEVSGSVTVCLKKVLAFSPQVLFPRLREVTNEMTEKRSYIYLMKELQESLDSLSTDHIKEHKSVLFAFFKSCMDTRLHIDDCDQINAIEDAVFGAFCKFLVKLEAKTFVDLYNSLQQRANKNTEQKGTRLITFMRFGVHVANLLKKHFVYHGIADSTLTIASELLKQIHIDNESCHELLNGDENQLDMLLCTVLQLVTTTFKCAEDTTNPKIFEFLLEPLTVQLENTLGGEQMFQKRVREFLAPCLVRFTVVSRDDIIWAELNKQILCRLRILEQPLVIQASLEVFESIVNSLGEDYLDPLMSDIMAYLTEVLDCPHPHVQKKTKQILSKMETVAGRSLQAYLE